MNKIPTRKTIRRRAFYESDESVNSFLILTMLEVCNQIDENYVEKVRDCANFLKEAIYNVRVEFPHFTIDEWYTIAVLCYIQNRITIIDEIKNTDTKTWIEFRHRNPEISSQAEKIYLKYKEDLRNARKR